MQITINEILQFILLKRYVNRKKYCSKECELYNGICDFCKHYHYNGADMIEKGKLYEGAIYTGDGWCGLHDRWQDPSDNCSNFECSNVKGEK